MARILARVSVGRHPQRLFDAVAADQRDGRGEQEADWSTGFSALILRKSFGRVALLIPAVLSGRLMCLTDLPIQRIGASPLLLIATLLRQDLPVSD